jgi:hypothetical protein
VGVGKTPGVGVGVAAGGGWTAKEVRVAVGLAGLASNGSNKVIQNYEWNKKSLDIK